MPVKKKDVEAPGKRKLISIYAANAYEIFRLAFVKANTQYKSSNWKNILALAINEDLKNPNKTIGAQYLYNLYTLDLLPKIRDKEKYYYPRLGIYESHLDALAEYTDINYLELDKRFSPPVAPPEYIRTMYNNNIPPAFKEYVSLTEPLAEINNSLESDGVTVVGIYGMPGMGKSLLAFDYASTYRSRYPGGCWYIPSSGTFDLRTKVKEFATLTWGISFSAEENQNEELSWQKLKHIFEDPFQYNEKHATLLIFDNIDDPLHSFTDHRIDADRIAHVDIIFTTRKYILEHRRIRWINVNGLTPQESFDILHNFRKIDKEQDLPVINEIIKRIHGFALAITIIATRLSLNEEASYEDLLQDIEDGNIDFLDHSGNQLSDISGHYAQKVTSHLFTPILTQLTEIELSILEYAALLPADQVALAWIERFVRLDFPDAFPAMKFRTDLNAWQVMVSKLKALSLWNESGSAQTVRIHRLLQSVIKNNPDREDQIARAETVIMNFLIEMSDSLGEGAYTDTGKWSVPILLDYAGEHLQTEHPNASFLNNIAVIENFLSKYLSATRFLEKSIEEEMLQDHPDNKLLGIRYSNLGAIERSLGNDSAARDLTQKSLDIAVSEYGADDPKLALRFSNMALSEKELGRYDSARHWMEKAIQIDERNHRATDPNPFLAMRYSNMVMIDYNTGDFAAAKKWLEKAIILDEKMLEADHPDLAIRYSNIGIIEQRLGNLNEARQWLEKAITIDEKQLGPDHPGVATGYSNLASIQQNLGTYAAAEELILKAIEIDKKKFELHHSRLGIKYTKMSTIQRDLGNLPLSKEYMVKALLIDEQNYPADHPFLGDTYFNMGSLEYILGNLNSAKEWLEKSMVIDLKHSDKNRLASNHTALAKIELLIDPANPSCSHLQKAYDISQTIWVMNIRQPKLPGTSWQNIAHHFRHKHGLILGLAYHLYYIYA